jgi:hypothetical protein
MLLGSVNALALDRGSLIENAVDTYGDVGICSAYSGLYQSALDSIDYKKPYSTPLFLSKNSKGIGFFANNLDFFFYELPGIIIAYILLSLIFRALFNYRVSKYLRKYSFYGTMLFVIYEGNIEQFSFYFFS